MAQTTTPCPRCHNQMVADVQQVFDLNQDPAAKERLLSGQVNLAVCPSCGFQSAVAVPVIYHDPEKELFLSYFPPEMNVPLNDQQKALGPLISQVVNHLPPEKRKGYLFQPQAMLTYDTLLEKILEADGITKEMLAEQEKKVNLLRRLLSSPEESVSEIIRQEADLIDQNFFVMFSNVQNSYAQARDTKKLQVLQNIQEALLNETAYGQEVKKRAESTQDAIRDLQELGDQLNQDTLLDLVLESPDDTYLQTLTGLARNGMDYTFFTKLTDRIEDADQETKAHYIAVREKLLDLIQKIDAALTEQRQARKAVFDEIMKEENLEQAIMKYARAIDESFLEVANAELQEARKNGDFVRSGKIQQLIDTITTLSKPPAEVEFLESLLTKADAAEIGAALAESQDKVTPEFRSMLDMLLSELEKGPDKDSAEIQKIRLIKTLAG
mgnify:CR=1 FL=1